MPSEGQTQLLRIEGFAGDFQVQFSPDQKEWTEAVGAIVFAPELISEADFKAISLTASEQIMGLEDLFAPFFPQANPLPTERRPGRRLFTPASYVAFLTGFNGEGNVADMARTLSLAFKDPTGISVSGLYLLPKCQGGRRRAGEALSGLPG